MTRPRIPFPIVVLLAAACLPAAARAEYPDAWKWTVGAGPSLFAPRMHGFNNALAYEGLNLLDQAWRASGASSQATVPTGFAKVEWGYGGQVSVSYEFNEDLRGGIFLGLDGVWKQGTRVSITDTSSYTVTSTVMSVTVTSSTNYQVTERASLPLLTVGVFLQKVFRYEEEPNLRTYLGGWGAYGALQGASFTGSFRQLGADTDIAVSYDLTAQGYAAGGLIGVEYAVARRTAAFAETGFMWCIIPKVQWLGDASAGTLTTTAGRQVNLDFSGFFIRIGVRTGLAHP